ncbi:hypothetical protein LRS05_05505 [Flavobacterium sp. J372]|uniref:hypothetical protein n=1 Tax=Flavobacterium sp. J372 TaxID=2898436 RepID=UPI002151A38B|nr:hypothetical protein [Flavobacterium sp. J372]MCR5861624.1 hypothetical protein [Flavobacterium sp. J372]
MNTQSITKVIAFASIVAGINMLSSCDSCNRKEESYDSTVETTTETDTTTTIAGDTTAYDQADATGTTGTGTGPATGRTTTGTAGTGAAGSTAGGSSAANETPSTTSRVASGSGASSPAYDRSNDPIENTNTPARVKGRAVDPGGTAGTGGGTGTGSTGNNSRVSKKSDQVD